MSPSIRTRDVSTFMTSSNTPEVKKELTALVRRGMAAEAKHREIAEAILDKFEVLSKKQERKVWRKYVAWVNGGR